LTQKTVREGMSSDFLFSYDADGESLLSRIVTVDETWIPHFEPQTKTQSIEWHHPMSPRKKKFKATPSAWRVMTTVSLHAERVIFVDIMPEDQIINSGLYT
jgi:hypothetical protein